VVPKSLGYDGIALSARDRRPRSLHVIAFVPVFSKLPKAILGAVII